MGCAFRLDLSDTASRRTPGVTDMIEFYVQIKWLHVAMVLLSGGLFMLRGLALQLGYARAMNAPWRYTSYAIDTVLLTSALMLLSILHLNPFAVSWLGVKLLLLVLYIVFGTLALKRGRTPAIRRICFALALLTYVFMISIARAHHPLGLLAAL